MNDRFSEELFLTNETGKMLYHKYAEHMPIIVTIAICSP